MVMTDPIADLLTRIRNAVRAKHYYLEVSDSKLKRSVLDVLVSEKFIRSYEPVEGPCGRSSLKVVLNYFAKDKNYIHDLQRVSKPGRRVYRKSSELKLVENGYGISIVSTSQGVCSDRVARHKNLGGEVLCNVW